jgi:hypothetical protein
MVIDGIGKKNIFQSRLLTINDISSERQEVVDKKTSISCVKNEEILWLRLRTLDGSLLQSHKHSHRLLQLNLNFSKAFCKVIIHKIEILCLSRVCLLKQNKESFPYFKVSNWRNVCQVYKRSEERKLEIISKMSSQNITYLTSQNDTIFTSLFIIL